MATNVSDTLLLQDYVAVSPTIQVATPGTATAYRGLSITGVPDGKSIGLVKYVDEKGAFASVATVGTAIGEVANGIAVAPGDSLYFSATGTLTTLAAAASDANFAGVAKDTVAGVANVAPAKLYVRVELGSRIAKP